MPLRPPAGALRLFYKAPEERRRKGVIGHPLGMPLHAKCPARPGRPLQRFNDSIRRPSGDAQALPWLVHGLMVRTVDARTRAARQFGQLPALDANWMQRLASPGASIVVHRISHFARNVLHQGPALMNVQELRAIADRQYGLTV